MVNDEEEFEDLKSLRKVNKYKLDEECIKQACAYHYWGEKAIDAKDALNRKESAMEVRRNELDLAFRQKPPKGFEDTKITEAVVQAYLNTHPDIQAIANECFELRRWKGLCDLAVEVMDQRKYMINELVQLHGRAYFQDPKRIANGEKVHKAMLSNLNSTNNED